MAELQPPHDPVALYKDVRTLIRVQDVSSMAGSLGRLLKGAAVCLGIGLAAAILMVIVLSLLFGTTLIGFRGWFLAYLIVLIALLIRYEMRTRVEYINDSLSGTDPNPPIPEEVEPRNSGFQIAEFASILVWGPRALIDGINGMRGRRKLAQIAVFDRAATLVVDLAKVQVGVDLKKLVHPPEDMDVFGNAVDLLDTHGWIGKATDGKSLWLNSTFREKLRTRNPTAGTPRVKQDK